jgi:hypothetical protein
VTVADQPFRRTPSPPCPVLDSGDARVPRVHDQLGHWRMILFFGFLSDQPSHQSAAKSNYLRQKNSFGQILNSRDENALGFWPTLGICAS